MMALHGLLAGIFAQTCAALLPLPQAEIEWFRDGRPFARDVPVRVTASERVYRRHHETGRTVDRVIACTTTGGVSYLVDRVGSDAPIRIPVALDVGHVRAVGSTTVRRIEPPADAARSGLWFTVSSPGIAVYGLLARTGVVEIRTPAPSGGFSVLRAVRRDPVPMEAAADTLAVADTERAFRQQIALLEMTHLALRDSIAFLRAALDSARAMPYSTSDVVEFMAVDVYVERGEYQAALALLENVRRRLRAWSDSTGTRHRALDPLDARLHQVLVDCAAAAAAPRSRRSRPITCTLDDGDE